MRRKQVAKKEYHQHTKETNKVHRDRQVDTLKTERGRQINTEKQCQVLDANRLTSQSTELRSVPLISFCQWFSRPLRENLFCCE